ncbi:MAG: NADH-quinone oxidoreductase subunit C [Candidatus Scalindua sp.]|nr:NADH-quinone oxidoreductase subunit C [Candidatus Scalindua sp.]
MNTDQIVEKYVPGNMKVEIYGNIITYKIYKKNISRVFYTLYHTLKLPLKTITVTDEREENDSFKIFYLFGVPGEKVFLAPYILLSKEYKFPSLASMNHVTTEYEKKIKSLFGLDPTGHLNPKKIILHENWPDNVFPLRREFDWKSRPDIAHTPFHFEKVEGDGIYEIPVGPVHAGIIEPGHFRFSVAGEEILLLEPRLGYTHKGSEKLFEVLSSMDEKITLSERVSGDSSFSHSLAFCQAIESLCEYEVTERSKYLRVIYSELERLANHFGDIGAIMLDTGFSFGGSNGGRLREIVMQLNELLTGSRFLRGVNTVGGVTKDISAPLIDKILNELEDIRKDFEEVIHIAENCNSLLNRLKGTGVLETRIARDHGVVGIVARSMGFAADARIDYPYAAYDRFSFAAATENEGDVYARFCVRVKESYTSIQILKEALATLPGGPCLVSPKPVSLNKASYGLGITEGWRGDIIYFVATNSRGQIIRVDVRDPSFLNWPVLRHAGKGNVVPDFPLINKSFNLSYSGFDL